MLSEQEKQKLADHYRNKDLYEPNKAAEQEPADFAPKMCGGGSVGMADGGPTPEIDLGNLDDIGQAEFNGPDTRSDTIKGSTSTPSALSNPQMTQEGLKDALVSQVIPPQTASKPALEGPGDGSPSVEANTAANPPPDASLGAAGPSQASPVKGLQPDQWDQLVKALSARPTLGQSAMSGLGGLADAIMQGVARAGNPGYQKNIEESRQNRTQNLINALTAKYGHERAQAELGLRGQELQSENNRSANTISAENMRAANALKGEKERTAAELGVRAQEAQAGRQQSGIEAAAKLPATGILHPSTWGRGNEIEQVREQLLKQGQGGGSTSAPVRVSSKAQFAALQPGAHFIDASGKVKVKH